MDDNELHYSPKVPSFFCKLCDLATSNKKDFNKHLMTSKHRKREKKITNDSEDVKINNKLCENNFVCNCGNTYKYRQGLYKHKKTCDVDKNKELSNKAFLEHFNENMTDKDLIMYLLKENKEFKELILNQSNKMLEQNSKMMELAVKPSSVANINNTNTNCNNKNQQFNLNVFLNEKCKNAMNMSDFIDSIKVNDEDFENIGKLGYVQGISNIFIKNLQKLDECIRPMHCSDAKREVIYIKENNEWKKDENQKAVRHVIAMIAHKNFKYMPFWTDANPGVFDGSTKKNDLFLKITNQITTAITPDDDVGICKIIRNVVNRVVIDKSPPLEKVAKK